MNMEQLIERINYLYKKSQEEGLSEVESKEQAELRKVYVERVKANFRSQLAGIKPIPPKHKN